MHTHFRLVCSSIVLAATVWLGPTAAASAAALLIAQDDHVAPGPNGKPDEKAAQPGHQSMAHMNAVHEQLSKLVGEMNQASGDAKIAAMAKLLTVLADHMAQCEQMMAGKDMPAHMQQMKESMMKR
jgi:hypothetical protein